MPREVTFRLPTAGGALGAVTVAAVIVAWPSMSDYTAYVLAVVVVQVIGVLSLNLLMGHAGQVSLGHAALVGVGAYGVQQYAAWGVPFPATVPLAVATTAVVGAVIGLPSLRITGLQLAATTLAFGIAAERLLFARPWDEVSTAGVVIDRPELLADDRGFLLVAMAALGLVLLVDRAVRRSRFGRAFFAVRDRADTAAAWGVPVELTKLGAYALSGCYAGLAGSLYAYVVERITPTPFDVWHSLGMVAAVVVGGAGSVAGVAVAGATLAGLPELMRSAARYTPLVGAVLLMLVPVLHSEGLGWLLDRPRRRPARGRRRRSPGGATQTPETAPAGAVLARPRRALVLDVPAPTLLEVRGLAVAFGGLEVLTSVDLTVGRGEVVGLIGPNGAGKSTVFNCLSGFLTPRRGEIRFRGRDLLALAPSARIRLGIVRTFQQIGLCAGQPVFDNLLLAQHRLARYGLLPALTGAAVVRRREQEMQERAWAALEALDLTGDAGTPVGDLPHGRQRLAEVAAAVAAGPELLLLDEPAAGMGPDESAELGARLARLAIELSTSVLLIEHHVPMVADLCSHVYVLDSGCVLAEGTPAEIQRDPEVQETYLGRPVGAGDSRLAGDDGEGSQDVPAAVEAAAVAGV